jgi:predicted nuclease of predicted toxin-antitoxin system
VNNVEIEPVGALRAMLDEMLPPVIAERLTAAGHDVVAVKAIPELIGDSDETLLVKAAAQQRILVTLDLADFAVIDEAWKASSQQHAGLIYISTATFRPGGDFVGAVVRSLTAAAETGGLPVPEGAMFLRRVSGD